jgi:hypothetical protein
MSKPRANDENTIRELKEDFALGGFSMKKFYAVEAAMVLILIRFHVDTNNPWPSRQAS